MKNFAIDTHGCHARSKTKQEPTIAFLEKIPTTRASISSALTLKHPFGQYESDDAIER